MRQTPFGVWNVFVRLVFPAAAGGSNEADAFWRLELKNLNGKKRRGKKLQ